MGAVPVCERASSAFTIDEVRAHRAAHAAVIDFDQRLFFGDDQLSVDADFAEFVDDHAD
jgi:hypothetical protein